MKKFKTLGPGIPTTGKPQSRIHFNLIITLSLGSIKIDHVVSETVL